MISINYTNIVFSDRYTNRNDDTIIIMIIKTMVNDVDRYENEMIVILSSKVIQRQELCIRDQNEVFVAVFRERNRIAVKFQ